MLVTDELSVVRTLRAVSQCGNQSCLNGGQCVDDVDNQTFTCVCSSQFTGTNCQTGQHNTHTAIIFVIFIIYFITIFVIIFITAVVD